MSFYTMFLWLLPHFYMQKRIKRFWIISLFSLVIIYWLSYMSQSYSFYWFVDGVFVGYIGFSYSNLQVILLFMLFGGMAYFMIGWRDQLKKQKQMENQYRKARLVLLKAQLNPHFLFNTLNNIQSYSGFEPALAHESLDGIKWLIKSTLLSDDMKPESVDKEVLRIKAYAKLVNLRFRNRNFVQIKCMVNLSGIVLQPFLFLPLLENAVKHADMSENSGGIQMLLWRDQECVHFEIRNKKMPAAEKKISEGTGNRNLEERLELHYPSRHTYRIEDSKDFYHVKLSIRCYEKVEL